MDVKFVNPFIIATLHVLDTIASVKAKAGKPYLKNDHVAHGDVSGVIGLTGEAIGTIAVSFSEKCIIHIVSRMFEEEITEINKEIEDATGEISNMISGYARQELEKIGKSLKAAIPTIIVGKNHSIKHFTHFPIVAIPFTTDAGDFAIEVCFEE